MTTYTHNRSISIWLLPAIAALLACDANPPEGIEFRSSDPSMKLEEIIIKPIPGGGGCLGCVSCFHNSSICFESAARYVGSQLGGGDDLPLPKLITDRSWQLMDDTGQQLCTQPGCAPKPAPKPIVTGHEIFTINIRQQKEEHNPSRLAFDISPSVGSILDGQPQLTIEIPDDLPAGWPSPEPTIKPPQTELDKTSLTQAMAHITFPSPDRAGFGSCSGFLISPRHVMTAAHCVLTECPIKGCSSDKHKRTDFYIEPDLLSVRLGGLDSPGESSFQDDEFFSVARIHLHSELNRDLAILELTTASDTAPIPLSIAGPKASKLMTGMDFEAYGYGVSQVPSWVAATVYDWGKLKQIELFMHDDPAPLNNPNQLLHLATADEGPPCRGDSGGPVIDKGKALAVMIAQVIERPEYESGEPSTKLETMAARAFAFTRFNSCGIGTDDDEISYIATRLDKPEIRKWIAKVLSSPSVGKDTQNPIPKADSLYK